MSTAIEFNHISKLYRLGLVSTGTISHDLKRWWTINVLRQEDPYLKIGETNDRSTKGNSDYVWALRDIDFKVEQGDVIGIIGKNGAGKSTLLKILSRVTGPTTGTIKARGRIGSLLEVGTGFHPELTGRENIFMNGSILGMNKHEIAKKLDEIIDFSGCERYIDTPVKRYSSGMTVRLGFAVAAHLDPEILVVDEVLAVGDAEFQKKAIGKMQDVSRGEGRTVLFVSHNMASIRKLCHTGVVLENGSVSFLGPVQEAVDKYMLQNTITVTDNSNLLQYTRPKGLNEIIRFTSIEFLNRDNQPITPHSGAFLRIRCNIEVSETCNKCRLAIDLFTSQDYLLMNFQSFASHGFLPVSAGEHTVTCDIEELPLTGGSYKLSLWADTEHGAADFLENAIPMEVVDDDYYQSGKILTEAHLKGKIVLHKNSWIVE